ncbi:hypothetical protein EST38_g2926 [Candolleomyces aberdarensis]|uniref:Glycosyltransferase family 32 protein n=1 Tax=Candolleomyces aberdarensis TaxID=2316362 RepID=A0A4Q2DTG9_9AGAR|nr:hypothetical protein EST38_g2926 [Candolleomyces aberdarensis]
MLRFGRKKGSAVFCFLLFILCFVIFAFAKRFGSHTKQWPTFKDPPTLIFKREDLQRIWKWEVNSGHYPSRYPIPEQIQLNTAFNNPSLPPRASGFTHDPAQYTTSTKGQGPRRVYVSLEAQPPHVAYPPRPIPGSVADLDVVMAHCDYGKRKYVRDCLEVLRVGAGLDNGKRVRRSKLEDWKYIYVEQPDNSTLSSRSFDDDDMSVDKSNSESGLVKKRGAEWEVPPLQLPEVAQYRPYHSLESYCDHESPKIFHMFWTGRFTDKPYLALLSFLFTQNLGLHKGAEHQKVCRPQFWMWINPGPAAAVPNPNARAQMYAELKESPWASPFLHPRFKDIIKFQLWNTTEQLDGVEELKNEWRTRDLFNSGGWVVNVPKKEKTTTKMGGAEGEAEKSKDDMLNRAGSKSVSSYDRLSVILSDMARFILCHRYGGIYLDADTIFLRDWEELWGWKGAFAYRWSRLPRYNTAVLKLNKGSALGKFLFRSALKNNLDFHPMTVSRYTKDAYLEPLLLRLPDALFDSAWLNTEDYQMDRPPQPFFTNFEHFFETPSNSGAAPQALGFDGFFKGAYSYHFHNFWWKPFDPARNWPDLGPRFAAAERKARVELRKQGITRQATHTTANGAGANHAADANHNHNATHASTGDELEDDQRDLSWATVLKRTFESYLRGERPNMYGEWLDWEG